MELVQSLALNISHAQRLLFFFLFTIRNVFTLIRTRVLCGGIFPDPSPSAVPPEIRPPARAAWVVEKDDKPALSPFFSTFRCGDHSNWQAPLSSP